MSLIPEKSFSAQSVVSEIPASTVTLDWEVAGEVLGNLLKQDTKLPGVILTEKGRVVAAISRGQYLAAVGRYLGIELFHGRPIRVMLDALGVESRLTVLPGNCRIQDALSLCLKRPDKLIYEPFLVAHDAAGRDIRMVDFLDLLMADARVSSLRNRQMDEILRTVSDGLLLMDREFTIQSEYSQVLERILETREIAGRKLPELLGQCLEPETAAKGQDYLHTLFNPKVIERLIVRINPLQEVSAQFGTASGKTLRKHLRFSFLRSARQGAIQRVLVRVEDATRQVELAAELEEQERRAGERMELGFQLVRADSQLLADFLTSLERELRRAEGLLVPEVIDGPGDSLAAIRDRIFRVAHGLKGEAGMLRLQSFERNLHALEEVLRAFQPQEGALASAEELFRVKTALDSTQALLAESHAVIQQFRGLARIGQGGARPMVSQGGEGEPVVPPAEPVPVGILNLVEAMAQEQAAQRGVQVHFHSHIPEAELPPVYRPQVKDCLVQFIRNSIAHGVESPEERVALGKPASASLQFMLRPQLEHRQWELIYQDDGRGLDLERIRQRMVELGWAWDNEEDLHHAIFQPGFSTAPTADLLAGRGVGMDLVRALVDEVGGYIQVHSQPGQYCAFQIVLPMTHGALSPAPATVPETRGDLLEDAIPSAEYHNGADHHHHSGALTAPALS